MSPHQDKDASSPTESNSADFTAASYRQPPPSGLRNLTDTPNSAYSDQLVDATLSSSFSSLETENRMPRPLIPGVYVPTVCFFDPVTEDLDTATISSHAVRLAKAGVTGLTTQGSNGEAVHLTHSERQTVTATTRSALDAAGFAQLPVLVGCGAQSVRESIQYCREAHSAGGDYALILPPSYYAPSFRPSAASVIEFFTAIADASPIALIIYNYPGAVSGMDLSSDVIIQLSKHPNIAGVKLTCGNTYVHPLLALNRAAVFLHKVFASLDIG